MVQLSQKVCPSSKCAAELFFNPHIFYAKNTFIAPAYPPTLINYFLIYQHFVGCMYRDIDKAKVESNVGKKFYIDSFEKNNFIKLS